MENTGTTSGTGTGSSLDEKLIKANEEKLKQDMKKAKDDEAAVSAALAQSKQKEGGASAGDYHKQTDTKADEFDPAQEFQNIMRLSPVVIFSKTYCGYSKALKNLFKAEYEIVPTPTIVELDKHENGRALQDYLGEKSGRKTVPNLFINGISRGGSDEMKKLHSEGQLLSSLSSWGEKNIKVSKINAPSNS